jgi:serpin B
MMMEGKVFALYQTDDLGEYVEVPHSGAASFRIVLPRAGVALPDVWRHLAAVPTFGRAATAPRCRRIKLILPRFALDWQSGLAAALERLGVRRMFSPVMADFSPIASLGALFVGDVRHRSMIRVCESGTEAGAVTRTQFTGYRDVLPPAVIEVNRPFLFDIVEHATGGVLLCGQVTDASPGTFPGVPPTNHSEGGSSPTRASIAAWNRRDKAWATRREREMR